MRRGGECIIRGRREEVAKQTDCIKLRGGRTIFHGVRVARTLGLEPNLFVTIKFWQTSVPEIDTSVAFSEIRAKFGKWVQRPARGFASFFAPPTFVWVIENPEDRGHLHAHWLVYVPPARQEDFTRKLNKWLASVGQVYSPEAIHIKPAPTLIGAAKYMLKGQFKSLARYYGIRHEYQGWVTGKRSGCSENIGPTQHERLWKAGKHPRPKRWRVNLFQPRLRAV
jgi:hypothetical protein